MATLQNIRSKGPLLVIVIGLALFAFIAGDAWKVLQPHQSQDVGEVNGKTLTAQEYQKMQLTSYFIVKKIYYSVTLAIVATLIPSSRLISLTPDVILPRLDISEH